MCLINFHIKNHPTYKLIIAANRDEAYDRPTEAAHFWPDTPGILAGRDLRLLGTWMGINQNGRFAALTNYRDPKLIKDDLRSRGEIIQNYLATTVSPEDYIEEIKQNSNEYNGFNLIVGIPDKIFYYNNIDQTKKLIEPGTHSVSNHFLNTSWPKVEVARNSLKAYVQANEHIEIEDLFTILANKNIAADELLPNTGVGIELERKLSAIFIQTPTYGTRSSTVILVDHDNNVTFVERTFKEGVFSQDHLFNFQIKKKPAKTF